MVRQKILLPYNFTAYDQKALDFVIRTFSDQQEADITLFNAYTPVPVIEMRGSPIMEQMKGTLSYFSQRIKEQEKELKAVRDDLIAKGFAGDRIQLVFEPIKKDVAGDIIDLAVNGRFNVVVLNRNPVKITRFFTKSVSNKVMKRLKEVDVNVVT